MILGRQLIMKLMVHVELGVELTKYKETKGYQYDCFSPWNVPANSVIAILVQAADAI